MLYKKLGNTQVQVSVICLGTMTYGEQNTEQEAHKQLDYALDNGINFIDTAELYAVPPKKETYTLTEQYIGNWLAKNGHLRDKIVLASKIAGPSANQPYIRGGSKFNRKHITEALNASLQRLKTDYLDLYQLHWPERKTNFFGRLGFQGTTNETWENNFLDILEVLNDFIKEGKIRHIGISNETPWGAMQYLKLAETHGLPRMVSIQNPYNLLNRTFEIGLAEIAIREKIGLLAYSPLAFGLLTGKYFTGEDTSNYRITKYSYLSRYNSEFSNKAAKQYVDLARSFNMSPAQMALAYINSREFVTSNIIGATNMEQLKENVSSAQIDLTNEQIEAIEKIHTSQPNPAP